MHLWGFRLCSHHYGHLEATVNWALPSHGLPTQPIHWLGNRDFITTWINTAVKKKTPTGFLHKHLIVYRNFPKAVMMPFLNVTMNRVMWLRSTTVVCLSHVMLFCSSRHEFIWKHSLRTKQIQKRYRRPSCPCCCGVSVMVTAGNVSQAQQYCSPSVGTAGFTGIPARDPQFTRHLCKNVQ